MADPAAAGNEALRKVVFVSIYLEENAEAPLLSDLPQNRTWDDRVSRAGFAGL